MYEVQVWKSVTDKVETCGDWAVDGRYLFYQGSHVLHGTDMDELKAFATDETFRSIKLVRQAEDQARDIHDRLLKGTMIVWSKDNG